MALPPIEFLSVFLLCWRVGNGVISFLFDVIFSLSDKKAGFVSLLVNVRISIDL